MTGPSIEATLTWLLRNADRGASAEVQITSEDGTNRYRARVWRDGTIVFRPVKR